jgi:anthranilate/para-aminobenzoate synthase component I
VNDPWTGFRESACGAENVGYFESRDRTRSGSATARWFLGEERAVELERSTRSNEVERTLRDFFGRHRGGLAMGYVGFDALGIFEPLLTGSVPTGPFPLGELALVPRSGSARFIPTTVRGRLSSRPVGPPRRDTFSRSRFEGSVRTLRAAIRAGEAYQVVLSRRREWRRPPDLLARADHLRRSERFAFFFYLRLGGRELFGASPESVVERARDHAWIDPIAGTRPVRAGPTPRMPLRRDPKELAEHRMLLDLARNDLGKVARPGSVRVEFREEARRYSRVEHLVSRVGAKVDPSTTGWDLLRATFPAGTVSGAPKVRATELLRREERTWRGPYGGTVGWMDGRGRCEWALAIRSEFATGRSVYTAAGAGIVSASRPLQEYDETSAKLSAVESVLGPGAGA